MNEVSDTKGRSQIVPCRPKPPEHLDGHAWTFSPAPEVRDWIIATFIAEQAPLLNEDHAHLRDAAIGVLWTDVSNKRAGRAIIGQCETMPPGGSMGKWQKERAAQQIETWFGYMPDFLLTFDATYSAQCDDASWCALVEHELYHAGQEIDQFGLPKFSKSTGKPVFAMRGHDVEEFVGVVRRYGSGPSNAAALIEAAKLPPQVGKADISVACGSCA